MSWLTFLNQLLQLCTARTVFSIGYCTVIHCDAGGVSLVDHWKAEKNWYLFNEPIIRCFLKINKTWRDYRTLNPNWSYQLTLAGRAINGTSQQVHWYIFGGSHSASSDSDSDPSSMESKRNIFCGFHDSHNDRSLSCLLPSDRRSPAELRRPEKQTEYQKFVPLCINGGENGGVPIYLDAWAIAVSQTLKSV